MDTTDRLTVEKVLRAKAMLEANDREFLYVDAPDSTIRRVPKLELPPDRPWVLVNNRKTRRAAKAIARRPKKKA